jgi:hypothetical protein
MGCNRTSEDRRFAFKVLFLETWARLYLGHQTPEEIRGVRQSPRVTSPAP